MKNRVCEELMQYQPANTEDKILRSWYIVNSVFNAFLAVSAIILNSVTIQALSLILMLVYLSNLFTLGYSLIGYSKTIHLKLYALHIPLSGAFFLQRHFSES